MKRRKFIRDSSLLALTVGVFGKIKWDGQAYVGEDPTTTDILGPFYRPGAPFRPTLFKPEQKVKYFISAEPFLEKMERPP